MLPEDDKKALQIRMIMIIIAMHSSEAGIGLSAKARHCSHCFQYFFSQPRAGFFFALISSQKAALWITNKQFNPRPIAAYATQKSVLYCLRDPIHFF
ncbi:MAG: hypothetical protein E7H57_01475 [Pantoea sp.]|nr:hypothetical protein [Pantoea sp.]